MHYSIEAVNSPRLSLTHYSRNH